MQKFYIGTRGGKLVCNANLAARAHNLLENQVGEQEHAVANVWGIQVGKLATQQIGDELQPQENEFNIANIIMPEITSNERCKEIYLLGI